MDKVIKINVTDILPSGESVLRHQGIKNISLASDRILNILKEAVDIFRTFARPEAVISEISEKEFCVVFSGRGENDPDCPVRNVYPRADTMALYALTMGAELSGRITALFNDNDFALGSMLDAAASMGADSASGWCERYYFSYLKKEGKTGLDTRVLGYSPGYCGWNISGQKNLFEYLNPERIGITLNSTYLMTPLKSVSGLLAAGKKEIHLFDINFSFCRTCKNPSCKERMNNLAAG